MHACAWCGQIPIMLKFGKVFLYKWQSSCASYNMGKTKFSSPRARVVKAANHLKHSKSLVISPMGVQA